MTNVPQQAIFRAALATGMVRSVAAVFAVIAYWEQVKGGVSVGGKTMRYRSVSEIGDDIGYSPRQVARAIKALADMSLIDKQIIWDPRVPGKRVNAFALTPVGGAMVSETEWPRRIGHSDRPEEDELAVAEEPRRQLRTSHDGSFKNREHPETSTDLQTLSEPARENYYKLAGIEYSEEDLKSWFVEYLSSSGGDGSSFWKGLDRAVFETEGKAIEHQNKVVLERAEEYLRAFNRNRGRPLGELDPLAAAVWAMNNPTAMAFLIEGETGKSPKNYSSSSYQLDRYGYVLFNFIEQEAKKSLNKKDDSDFWNGLSSSR